MTGSSIPQFADLFEPPPRNRPIHPAELAYAVAVGFTAYFLIITI